MEGMATGKPVVATDVGGTAELVEHEQTGLLVPPHDTPSLAKATLRLLGDQKLRTRIRNNGQRKVMTRFPVARMVERTEALYEELYRSNG
jgi:glycosyltransferase involved in cell wall biosynthesis